MAVDVGQGTAAMEDGLGVTLFACHGNTSFHIFLHARIGLEITVDKLLCFAPATPKTLCQTKGTDAIDDAEIGGFGSSALVGRNFRYVLMEDLCCRGGMDVLTAKEGLYQVFVLTEVCHDAQFYLTIVGREEQLSVVGDEGLTHLLAHGIAYRDIL